MARPVDRWKDVLRKALTVRLTPVTEAAIVLFLAAACVLMFQRMPLGRAVTGLLAFAGAWTLAGSYALGLDLVLPGLTLGAALAAAVVVGLVYRYFVSDRERNAIRRYFSLYLAPDIVNRLLASDAPPALGGERREVTILFSDIVGYTEMAESMSPESVVDLINQYFSRAAEAVERHHGFVDKFMGDGMLAVFGAPLPDPNHAAHAVAAAVDLLRATGADSGLTGPDGAPLRTRIGVATGQAVIGNVGSDRRLNYTVIGDTVNLAARLESENTGYGTSIIVSEDTARAAGVDAFDLVGHVAVRGRHAEATVYTPKQPSS